MPASNCVLVVEDDDGYGHALVRQLRAAGIEAQAVTSAFAALDVIEAGEQFGLLVLDVRLGGGQPHGVALARMIRNKRTIKILFLTAYEEDLGEITEDLGVVLRKSDGIDAATQAIATALAAP